MPLLPRSFIFLLSVSLAALPLSLSLSPFPSPSPPSYSCCCSPQTSSAPRKSDMSSSSINTTHHVSLPWYSFHIFFFSSLFFSLLFYSVLFSSLHFICFFNECVAASAPPCHRSVLSLNLLLQMYLSFVYIYCFLFI